MYDMTIVYRYPKPKNGGDYRYTEDGEVNYHCAEYITCLVLLDLMKTDHPSRQIMSVYISYMGEGDDKDVQ